MPWRERRQQNPLSQNLSKLKHLLAPSPLDDIYNYIEEVVLSFQQNLDKSYVNDFYANHLSSYLVTMLSQLPQSFEDRFYFDAQMIQSLSEEWNSEFTQLSSMIIPKSGNDWGHASLPLPTYSQSSVHVINMVLFPGEDRLEEIDLLTYPFICHELGHNVLFKQDSVFSDCFRLRLEHIENGLLRQSLADKGPARVLARNTINNLRQFWNPTPNHFNWAHEIAMDVIALWTAGPAYLATFQDILEDEELNPYQLGQSHPPYELRANALVHSSRILGWENYIQPLKERVNYWLQSKWQKERHNHYVAYTNSELTRECVSSAIEACETLSLPRYSKEMIITTQEKLSQNETPEWGSEVFISAWLQWQILGESAFSAWEMRVVKELSQAVIPESL